MSDIPQEETTQDIPQDNPQAEQDLLEREQIEAAFSGQTTETPSDEEAEPDPAEQAPKIRQITEDEWTELQSRAAEVLALKATLEKTSGTAFGKIGGIERRLNEIASAKGGKLSKDKIDRLRSDLPEIAELFDEISVLSAPAPAPDTTEIFEKAREEARRAAREEALADQHEDWREVTAAPEFAAFVQGKGPDKVAEITKASQTWNHRVIARALTEFKEEQAKALKARAAQDTRRDRIRDAVTPRGSGAPPVAGQSEAEQIMSGFNRRR